LLGSTLASVGDGHKLLSIVAIFRKTGLADT
jgi:hypothetical protein